jgi:hypothetical protein
MRDFIAQLEGQLVLAAEAPPRPSRPIRAAAVLGLAVVLALVGVLVYSEQSTHDRAFAFPVLSRPLVDASSIDIASELKRDGADLQQARSISTPFGPGYVIPTANGGLCLAVPDQTDGYGETCGTGSEVAAHGLALSILPVLPPSADGSNSPAEFVAVLPAGASAPTLRHSDGSMETLDLTNGVAATLVREDATVSYVIDGKPQTSRVQAGIHVGSGSIGACKQPTSGPYEILPGACGTSPNGQPTVRNP